MNYPIIGTGRPTIWTSGSYIHPPQQYNCILCGNILLDRELVDITKDGFQCPRCVDLLKKNNLSKK